MTQRTNNASVPGISSTPIVIPKEPRFPGPVPGQTERQLTFRGPITARHNPFRIGALGFFWSRKPNQLYLPLLLLSVSPHVLAHTILALVASNGGDTED